LGTYKLITAVIKPTKWYMPIGMNKIKSHYMHILIISNTQKPTVVKYEISLIECDLTFPQIGI